MDIIKLCIVFMAIIVIIWMKRPLFLAISGGLAAAVILYRIPLLKALDLSGKSVVSWGTISIVLSFYLVTFLQRMLEGRDHLGQAQRALDGIFHDRRINASLAPAVIGLLPSAGAMTICGNMVNHACEGYLDQEEKTFVTSFFRHIPESFLPTYSSILIALTLSGVNTASFVIAMFPMVLLLFILGYFFYLRKIPKETEINSKTNKGAEIKSFVKSLWSVALIVGLILVFNLPVYVATPIVITLNFFIDRFLIKEIRPMFVSAFEPVIMFNTFLIMIFKDIINYTGVINQLPELFSKLPLPTFAIFGLIFFFGTIVSGSNAIIALCMPMAMAALPGAGLPLVVFLMCYSYAAMQVSPTHICLFIATEYFHTSMGALVKRTIPVIFVFCSIVAVYSWILTVLL